MRTIWPAFFAIVSLAPAQAQIARKGRLLLEDDFRTPSRYTSEFQPVADGWRVRAWHGEWVRTGPSG